MSLAEGWTIVAGSIPFSDPDSYRLSLPDSYFLGAWALFCCDSVSLSDAVRLGDLSCFVAVDD
jgi:hypothetical protein